MTTADPQAIELNDYAGRSCPIGPEYNVLVRAAAMVCNRPRSPRASNAGGRPRDIGDGE